MLDRLSFNTYQINIDFEENDLVDLEKHIKLNVLRKKQKKCAKYWRKLTET